MSHESNKSYSFTRRILQVHSSWSQRYHNLKSLTSFFGATTAMTKEISSHLLPKFNGCRSLAIATWLLFNCGNTHLNITDRAQDYNLQKEACKKQGYPWVQSIENCTTHPWVAIYRFYTSSSRVRCYASISWAGILVVQTAMLLYLLI